MAVPRLAPPVLPEPQQRTKSVLGGWTRKQANGRAGRGWVRLCTFQVLVLVLVYGRASWDGGRCREGVGALRSSACWVDSRVMVVVARLELWE